MVYFGVYFADDLHGWIAGSGGIPMVGKVARTEDGGLTWDERPIGSDNRVHSVKFLSDGQNGWAAGWAGTIVHSTDAGLNWTVQSSGTTQHLNAIDFVDLQNGWAVGDTGTVLHTTNGGRTWLPQSVGTRLDLKSVDFLDAGFGWAVGGDNVYGPSLILHTVDGGMTWLNDNSPMQECLFGVAFTSDHSGYAVGEYGGILHHSGNTWSAPRQTAAPLPQSLALSAYPNPFNPVTTLTLHVPRTGLARLDVYDITGRLVRTLNDRVLSAGEHTFTLNAASLSSGIYFARLQCGAQTASCKIALVR